MNSPALHVILRNVAMNHDHAIIGEEWNRKNRRRSKYRIPPGTNHCFEGSIGPERSFFEIYSDEISAYMACGLVYEWRACGLHVAPASVLLQEIGYYFANTEAKNQLVVER